MNGNKAPAAYNASELMAIAASKEIKDCETVFAGIGLPLLGTMSAKFLHAPNIIFAVESGSIGPEPYRLLMSVADNASIENAPYATSMWRVFSDQQAGFFDLGMIGGAQVDKFGNLNSTAIFGEGDYYRPQTRLPGSGGANDIASSAKRTVITIPLQKQRFLERVDYVTSPGYLNGGDARKQNGLLGDGPDAVITDKCIFRFHPDTKELYLHTLYPGVTFEDVQNEVSWELSKPYPVKEMEPPSASELELIRSLDPNRLFTGNGFKSMTFESYLEMLEQSLVTFPKLYKAYRQ